MTVSDAPHVLDDLAWRGLLASTTDLDALRAAMDAEPITFYCGIDPTGPSMHVGHLVQVITMSRLQQAGHRPIALVGGATGLIGDPKPNAERSLVDADVVAGWADRLRGQLEPFFDFDGPNGASLANNLEWTADLSAIDLLRDIGKHFSVNRMLDREAVRGRLASESGLSYTEFSYVILQSLDYLELFRRRGCRLQTGGSDQWGNLAAGVDLIRRVEGAQVHAITTPLLTKADGTKFGKTESGAVWLDPRMTSPYAFHQFWFNTDDADVVRYLKVLTTLPREQIEDLEQQTVDRPAARAAQRTLARELTTLVHGAADTARVEAAAAALFGGGDLGTLDADTLAAALSASGCVSVPGSGDIADGQIGDADDGWPVVDLLVASGLSSSKGAARRTIAEGGAYVNNVRVGSVDQLVPASVFLHGRWLVLRRGRRHVAGVERRSR